MKLTYCPGFDTHCGEIISPATTWTVMETPLRDESQLCERCALEALRYTYAEVVDPNGAPMVDA